MRLSGFITRSLRKCFRISFFYVGKSGVTVDVRTAKRFGNDAVDELVAHHVLGRQLEGFSGFNFVVPRTPQDAGAGFWRNHRIPCVFHHEYPGLQFQCPMRRRKRLHR